MVHETSVPWLWLQPLMLLSLKWRKLRPASHTWGGNQPWRKARLWGAIIKNYKTRNNRERVFLLSQPLNPRFKSDAETRQANTKASGLGMRKNTRGLVVKSWHRSLLSFLLRLWKTQHSREMTWQEARLVVMSDWQRADRHIAPSYFSLLRGRNKSTEWGLGKQLGEQSGSFTSTRTQVWIPGINLKKLGMAVCASDPSAGDTEAGGSLRFVSQSA